MSCAMAKYVEFEVDGINYVHVMSVLSGGEYSVCGYAFDEHNEEGGRITTEFIPTKKRTVTCPQCIREIQNLRYVKIQK